MSEVHRTTIKDRIKKAIAALRDKPAETISYGIKVTQCSKCDRTDLSRIVARINKEIEENQILNSREVAAYREGLYKALEIIEEGKHR